MSTSVYDFTPKTSADQARPLAEFRGKVLLIVNTASQCGFTPQFAGLEELYEKYRHRGLEILGFPCNQFGKQEPGSNAEISEFCQLNYGVSFPMFGKIEVNGRSSDPLYRHLKHAAPGALGTRAIKWNFTKFLIDSSGQVVNRFAPATAPRQLEAEIEALIEAQEVSA